MKDFYTMGREGYNPDSTNTFSAEFENALDMLGSEDEKRDAAEEYAEGWKDAQNEATAWQRDEAMWDRN